MVSFVSFKAITANSRLNSAAVTAALDQYTIAHCGEIITKTAVYPGVPGPPNVYVRTFTLVGEWRAERLGLAHYQITNPARDRRGRFYAGYVHGPDTQTSFHRAHGWKNIRDAIDNARFAAGAQAIISGSL